MNLPLETRFNTCVIFGGTGFIGSHFALFVLKNNLASYIILADLLPLRPEFANHLLDPRLTVCKIDVRDSFKTWNLPDIAD